MFNARLLPNMTVGDMSTKDKEYFSGRVGDLYQFFAPGQLVEVERNESENHPTFWNIKVLDSVYPIFGREFSLLSPLEQLGLQAE